MKQHIPCLDGIRGGLALWVFWGHVAYVVGFRVPFVENLALAVDLFMLLSGFIMAWQWELGLQRPDQKPFGAQVSNFWVRRFFRISPLYYTLFFISILVTPSWNDANSRLMATFHPSEAHELVNYPLASLSNISAHLTYAFGLIPRFASNNALPDWSLSLEMQFYLALPFLMLLCRPSRILILSIGSVAVCLVARHYLSTQAASGATVHFPHPSVLPLKLQIFAAGMALGWLAANKAVKRNRMWFWFSFLLPLVFVPHPVAIAAIAISALVISTARPVAAVANFLGTPPFRLSGDLSYCVYLIHPIPCYFILDLASRSPVFRGMAGHWRFAVAVAVLTPLIYLLAYIAHKVIEVPGIELGRRIAARRTRISHLSKTAPSPAV